MVLGAEQSNNYLIFMKISSFDHKASSPPQYSCNVVFLKITFLCEHRWADKSLCSLDPPFCLGLSATGSPMQFPDLHRS